MTAPRKPGFVLPVAVTLTVLLGLYVGAYYWMVSPKRFDHWYSTASGPERLLVVTPEHAIPNSEKFFAPIHWLDRSIRPYVWEPTP